jgi:CheY-like chemotaxis protein
MVKNVLIVDDVDDDLKSMKEVLGKEGYRVLVATNGADALDQLSADGIDLILIDIKMPTLSGYDLLRLARQKVNHNVKMIFVTVLPEKEVSMDDVDGYLQKPFSSDSLMEKVKSVLEGE